MEVPLVIHRGILSPVHKTFRAFMEVYTASVGYIFNNLVKEGGGGDSMICKAQGTSPEPSSAIEYIIVLIITIKGVWGFTFCVSRMHNYI